MSGCRLCGEKTSRRLCKRCRQGRDMETWFDGDREVDDE